MTAIALERLSDPLVTPILALLKDAVNADLAAAMTDAGISPTMDAVKSTVPHPISAQILTADPSLPMLVCYRVRQVNQRRTFGYVDQLCTLRLQYITDATSVEQIGSRWPLLDRTWRACIKALCDGHHPAHASDDNVLEDAGVVWVNEAAQKSESFLGGGDFVFPQWEADIQVTWRDAALTDVSDLDDLADFAGPLTQCFQPEDEDYAENNGDVSILVTSE